LTEYPITYIQIISPHDEEIQKKIVNNLHPWEKSWDTSILINNARLTDPLQEAMDSYMKALGQDVLEAELNLSCKIKFTYSAMHGVGYLYMAEAFRTANFQV
jgi:phosphomannomutase